MEVSVVRRVHCAPSMLQRDETSNMAGRLWIGTVPLRRTCLAGPSNAHVLPCPARAAITSASYQTASTLASGADKLVGVASNADFISQAEFEHGLRGQGLSFQVQTICLLSPRPCSYRKRVACTGQNVPISTVAYMRPSPRSPDTPASVLCPSRFE